MEILWKLQYCLERAPSFEDEHALLIVISTKFFSSIFFRQHYWWTPNLPSLSGSHSTHPVFTWKILSFRSLSTSLCWRRSKRAPSHQLHTHENETTWWKNKGFYFVLSKSVQHGCLRCWGCRERRHKTKVSQWVCEVSGMESGPVACSVLMAENA